MQSSIHASLKRQDGGTPVSKWTGLCIFSLYLEFTALQWIPVLLLTHVSTSTSLCAFLWCGHHYSFCVFGVASHMKSVEFKQLSPYQLFTEGVACWDVTWPNDPQTRFCQYTGMPLDRPHWKTTGAISTLGCHWNNTGWCQHPVVFQWRSSVNLHNWNTLEDHWSHKYTGTTLDDASTQRYPSGDPVLICIIGTHWKTTGKPLEDHLKHTGNTLVTNNSFSSGIPVYTGV